MSQSNNSAADLSLKEYYEHLKSIIKRLNRKVSDSPDCRQKIIRQLNKQGVDVSTAVKIIQTERKTSRRRRDSSSSEESDSDSDSDSDSESSSESSSSSSSGSSSESSSESSSSESSSSSSDSESTSDDCSSSSDDSDSDSSSDNNPRSNRPERRTALVVRELARYKVDIAALSEARFSEKGQLEEVGAGYTFFCSGHPRVERRDPVVVLGNRKDIVGRLPCLSQGINDRLMSLRLPLREANSPPSSAPALRR
nr:unnamed protein product [Spirometra erinaceieuropaei]